MRLFETLTHFAVGYVLEHLVVPQPPQYSLAIGLRNLADDLGPGHIHLDLSALPRVVSLTLSASRSDFQTVKSCQNSPSPCPSASRWIGVRRPTTRMASWAIADKGLFPFLVASPCEPRPCERKALSHCQRAAAWPGAEIGGLALSSAESKSMSVSGLPPRASARHERRRQNREHAKGSDVPEQRADEGHSRYMMKGIPDI